MPVPVQFGGITDRLRKFLRIRGRLRLTLDETIVPTVQVQDLTAGPYQAGVTPCAGTQKVATGVGNQMLIFINPGTTFVPFLANDPNFIGRSFTARIIEFMNVGAAPQLRVGLVPRGNLGPVTLVTPFSMLRIQDGNGIDTVPVVTASVTAIPFVIFPAVQEFWAGFGIAATQIRVPHLPPITIRSEEVIVVEQVTASGTVDMNVSGTYNEQPQ